MCLIPNGCLLCRGYRECLVNGTWLFSNWVCDFQRLPQKDTRGISRHFLTLIHDLLTDANAKKL